MSLKCGSSLTMTSSSSGLSDFRAELNTSCNFSGSSTLVPLIPVPSAIPAKLVWEYSVAILRSGAW